MMTWVARPATVSVPNAKARSAEPLARSMATIIATPMATPAIRNKLCNGRRHECRQASRKMARGEEIGCEVICVATLLIAVASGLLAAPFCLAHQFAVDEMEH